MIIETLTCAKGKSCQQQVGKFILKYLHFQFKFYLKSIKLNFKSLKCSNQIFKLISPLKLVVDLKNHLKFNLKKIYKNLQKLKKINKN